MGQAAGLVGVAMIVGFTGTRNGMTEAQVVEVAHLITKQCAANGRCVGLHGDCIGADANFHRLAEALGYDMQCRPCTFDSMRAHTGAREIAEPTNPMARNRAIAKQCDVLIGCPPNDTELKRGSGTWATIRYGVKYGKPVWVVYPDGRVERRGGVTIRANLVRQATELHLAAERACRARKHVIRRLTDEEWKVVQLEVSGRITADIKAEHAEEQRTGRPVPACGREGASPGVEGT